MRRPLSLAAAAALLCLVPGVAAAETASHIDAPTHREADSLRAPDGGRIRTFCLDGSGRVIAAVGKEVVAMDRAGEVLFRAEPGFKPTAVNVDPDGTLLVAGNGRLARLSADGEVLAAADAPNLGDPETFRARAEEAAREQAARRAEMWNRQLETIDEQIAKLEEKPEEERSKVDAARLEALAERREMYATAADEEGGEEITEKQIDRAIRGFKTITAIATDGDDVFVSTRKLTGYGYAVWRTDREFAAGVNVIESVGGCCGQMDLQCSGDKLVIAENTSFKVGLYDRDGNSVDSFGKQDRASRDGFGSCCNPMNVRPLADGSILTAESSIGHIKRFAADGEFMGYVGKAEVGPGCKHCAVDYDPASDRYFMLSTSANAIFVLASIDSLGGTAEDPETAALRATFGERLVGTWTMKQPEEGETKPADNPMGAPVESVALHADGSATLSGGFADQIGWSWSWTPKSSEGPDAVTVQLVGDQMNAGTFAVAWGGSSEDAAAVTLSIFNRPAEPIAATFTPAESSAPCASESSEEGCGESCEEKGDGTCTEGESAPVEETEPQPVAALD